MVRSTGFPSFSKLALLWLLAAPLAFAQSTTVSGTITDANAQAFANGTYRLDLLNANQLNWSGGAITTPLTGVLDGTGSFAGLSVPSNSAITPTGTQWKFTFCTSFPSPCYSKLLTVTGATLNVSSSITPPAISVSANSFVQVAAYADSEITGAVVGSTYYNVTLATSRVCTALTSGVCSTWASSSGTATPCTVTALSLQYNNAGAFGCVPDLTFSTPHTLLAGAASIVSLGAQTGSNSFILPSIAGAAPTSQGAFAYDTTQDVPVIATTQLQTAMESVVLKVDNAQNTASNDLVAATIGTTETAFASNYTVPANFLTTKKALRVTIGTAVTASASAPTVTFRLRWGGVAGTIIYQSNSPAPAAGTGRIGATFLIQGTAAAGASAVARVNMVGAVDLGSTTAIWTGGSVATSGPAIATNASSVLTVTMQFGAATAGNDVELSQFMVEEVSIP